MFEHQVGSNGVFQDRTRGKGDKMIMKVRREVDRLKFTSESAMT